MQVCDFCNFRMVHRDACIRLGLLSVVFFSVVAVAQDTGNLRGSNGSLEQILVFDAGSSGTRIHIFNMHMPPGGSHVPRIDLSVRDAQTLKVKPGLSEFATKEDLPGCRENIQRLVDFASKFVPLQQRSATAVVLKATAGLRAVEKAKAEAVLATVRDTLRASGYRFQDEWVDIIKGKEEAGLAWVAANYLKGTFDGASTSGGSSMGVIEMGGGSTQVSFEVDESEREKVTEIDQFNFKTALGRVYSLYAHSYLGFGQDYAQSKLQECMKPDDSADPCYPKGYARSNSKGTKIEGTGDSGQCKTKIQALLFDDNDTKAPGRYVHELPLRGSFVATENFFYLRNDLGFAQKEGVRPSDAEASDACGRDLATAGEKACFGMSYQLSLLSILQTSRIDVQVMRKINGGDIDWAMGAALVHLLDNRDGGAAFAIPQSPILLALLVASALLLLAVFVTRRGAKGSPRSYDPTLFGAKSTGLE